MYNYQLLLYTIILLLCRHLAVTYIQRKLFNLAPFAQGSLKVRLQTNGYQTQNHMSIFQNVTGVLPDGAKQRFG